MSDRSPAEQELLTVEQVATEFQLTSQTIRNWIKSGILPAVKLRHVYRVKREDVDAMIAREHAESGEMGTHRDLWAPDTLGLPYQRRDGGRPPSVWDGADPVLPTRRR